MYQVVVLQSVRQTMAAINAQLINELNAPEAADRLTEAIIRTVDSLSTMPYRHPAYRPSRPLRHEYRYTRARNHLVFYRIDQAEQVVTVTHIVHGSQDLDSYLD
ncbi:type II toxin-antitoxin system RelE/ParE family toxin [Actinomyces ruminicola]|uniref:type II toxin-antitoxin system RelE/ParE family toxin n=1 Tax=Actinomyces ruminicola TaxID=332524 RepID=UPI0011CA2AFD|nr:type II toxin-antitoxin system RelE/ParE family toxin [Actinomyces ruminicola]